MTRRGGFLLAGLLAAILGSAPGRGPADEDSRGVPSSLDRQRLIVRLADQSARASLLAAVRGAPLELTARHERVVEGLRAIHAGSLLAARPALDAARGAGALHVVDSLWIINAVVVELDPAWIARLETDPAIEAVVPDRRLAPAVPEAARRNPRDRSGAGTVPPKAGATAVPVDELVRIRVPDVWAEGITGQGTIVANIDTGVNGEDDTLEDRWRGFLAGSDAAWFAPSSLTVFPEDDDSQLSNGHGTATMGIMTGGEETFGVAFDATWIAGDLFEGGEGFVSTALKIFEWMIDPDGDPSTVTDVPDVVNNSYVITDPGPEVCDPVFDDAIDAVEAAGAIVVWAAGNFGALGVASPANRADSPVNAFSVGGVDEADEPVADSGRGVSACGGAFANKPEVMAPGEDVTSRNRFNQTVDRLTGTSFAAPMASGILALMRSKNPTITPEAAKAILLDTARDLGVPGDDPSTGQGLLDAAAALAQVERPSAPLARLVGYRHGGLAGLSVKLGTVAIEASLILHPGGSESLAPLLTNHGPALPATTATLSSRTPGVTIDRPTVSLTAATTGALFGPEGDGSLGVSVSSAVPPGSPIELVLSIQGATIGPFRTIVPAGEPVAGTFATHDAGPVRLSVTNFGGLGFFTGRVPFDFLLLGEGFRFPPSSPNWLFHGSFLAGVDPDRLADDIPYGTDLSQSTSDWTPLFGLPVTIDQAAGGQRIVAGYDDHKALRPLGLAVRQESFAFGEPDRSFVLLQYVVTNTSDVTLGGLRLGLFADWDLRGAADDPSETAGWDPQRRLGFVEGTQVGQPTLGVVWLDDVPLGLVTYAVVRREAVDSPALRGAPAPDDLATAEAPLLGEFTDEEKWTALSSGQTATSETQPQDLFQIIGVGPIALAAGATDTVAVALVAANDRAALQQVAQAAREVYFRQVLGQEPPPPPPTVDEVVLRQNYPNPFRVGSQSTTIEFALPAAGSEDPTVRIAVYDVLGRLVRTLVEGTAVPGENAATWDGRDESGGQVPSGVYVIRVEVGGVERTIRVLAVR